jgi:hypothetical protein
VAFFVGQKLAASDLDDFNPGGDVNPGDDIALGSGGVITWSGDTNLYRASAGKLKTDHILVGSAAQIGRPIIQCRQVSGLTQALAASTPAAISMTGEDIDTLNGHSTSVNTSRFTPTVAGQWRFWGQLVVATGTALTMAVQFRKNGNVDIRAPYGMFTTTTQGFAFNTCQCHAVLQLNGTTDYVELWGNVSNAINTAANLTDAFSYMIGEYWGP